MIGGCYTWQMFSCQRQVECVLIGSKDWGCEKVSVTLVQESKVWCLMEMFWQDARLLVLTVTPPMVASGITFGK